MTTPIEHVFELSALQKVPRIDTRTCTAGLLDRPKINMCIILIYLVTIPHATVVSAQEEQDFVFVADPVTEALEYVEAIERQRNNCSFGPTLNLEYSKERWTNEAMVTVRAANLLTFFARTGSHIIGSHPDDVNILYSVVRANVNNYEKIFGSAIAFDLDLYRDYEIYCPYAFISPDGVVTAKDLSIGYDYHDNGTDWFWVPFERFNHFNYTEPSLAVNPENHHRLLHIEDGYWTQPYFDCGGGDVWMVTFSMPFFTTMRPVNTASGVEDNDDKRYIFAGVTTIDVVLDDLDINQCPRDVNVDDSNVFDPFVNTHKCQNTTTKCVQLPNQGFKRGTYQCQCSKGFYFPDVGSEQNAFDGTVVEDEYSKAIRVLANIYDSFRCLPCLVGCDECVDDSPCFLDQNIVIRYTLGILQCVFILGLFGLGMYTFIMKENKVIKAASPGLLYVFLFGAAITYSKVLVEAFFISDISCCFLPWLKCVGFALAYGALLFKTWRITVVFKVRSAKPTRITDNNLYLRIGILVLIFALSLGAWTALETPKKVIMLTQSGKKYYSCSKTYWTYIGEAGELLLLAWGVYLCVKVRKAPSAFNEAKYISVCIYNKTLMSFFSLVLILFVLPTLDGGADMYFVVEFARVHVSMSMIVGLLFGSKMYHVYHYDENEGLQTQTGKKKSGPGTGTGLDSKSGSSVRWGSASKLTTIDASGPELDLSISNTEVESEIERMRAILQEIADSLQLSDADVEQIRQSANLNPTITRNSSRLTEISARRDNIGLSGSSNALDRIEEDSCKPGPSGRL